MIKLKPCPDCGSQDIVIDSCVSMAISEATCNDCGHWYQCGAFEENMPRHWNKHVKKVLEDRATQQ